jgi:putative FmdB family regulatory protein
MPTYDYECLSCQHRFEATLGFNDPAPACPHCGKDVKKVFSSVGIVFKGTGFYKTDSRSESTSSSSGD